jgi:hypothetical protein
MISVTTKLISEPKRRLPGVHLVYYGDEIIGGLERHRDTRTTSHPYRAYGIKDLQNRDLVKFLGSFYDRDGGKDAAVKAIEEHYISFTC